MNRPPKRIYTKNNLYLATSQLNTTVKQKILKEARQKGLITFMRTIMTIS